MNAAAYTVVTTSLKTGTVQDTLSVVALSYTDTLNAAGGATVTIPLDSPAATPTKLAPGATGIAVLRDGVPVWYGILWTLAADLAGGTLTLNASGMHSYFKGRYFLDGRNDVSTEQATIIKNWFTYFAGKNGLTIDTSTVTSTGHLRTTQWTKYEAKNAAEAIDELADNEGGFNFRYVPYWITSGTKLGIRFTLTSRNGVDIAHVLTHRVNCNVTQVTYDSTALATTVYAMGADNGAGIKLTGIQTNAALAATMPEKTLVTSYPDVKLTETLISKAGAAIAAGAAPIAIPALTLYPDTFTPVDFVPGGACSVEADSGYVALLDDFVVTETKTDVDTNGRETITLSLANRELFNDANPS